MIRRNFPGEFSPAEYPLVCTEHDSDSDKPCHGRPVYGDHLCARHWGRLNSKTLRRRQNLADHYVGKGPVDMKGISRKDEDAIFLGAPRDVDPGVALLEEIHRSAGHVEWFHQQVQKLNEQSLVWNKTLESEEESGDFRGPAHRQIKEYRNEVSKWYDLYERERRHLASVATAALKAGVEERRVRLEERGVDLLETAMTSILRDLGVDPHSARAREVVGTHLRAVLAGPEDMFGYTHGGKAVQEAQATVINADAWESEKEF